jgi:hypothetical protein
MLQNKYRKTKEIRKISKRIRVKENKKYYKIETKEISKKKH